MIGLFVLTVATCLACTGWGLALHRVLAIAARPQARMSLSDFAVLGTALLTFLAMAANFLLPLTGAAGLASLVLGCAISLPWLWHEGRAGSALRMSLAAMICGALYFSVRLIQYRLQYDTGLYHMPSLNWVAAHPVPLGLANLENRLGFDSSWLMFHAALRLPLAGWGSLKVVECFVWVLPVWVIFDGLASRWRDWAVQHAAWTFAAALLLGAYAITLGPNDVASTDNAPNVFGMLSVIYFLECVRAIEERNEGERRRTLLMLVACASLAITGKLSMLPLGLLAAAAIAMALRCSGGRVVWVPLLAGTTFMATWLVRNVLLTGCLAYPVALTCLETPSWGVGVKNAVAMERTIQDWARAQTQVFHLVTDSSEGIASVAREALSSKPIVFVLLLAIVGLWLVLRRAQADRSQGGVAIRVLRSWQFLMVSTATVLGLALLLHAGPLARFGWSYIVLVVLPLYAILFASVRPERILAAVQSRLRRMPIRAGAAVLAVAVVARAVAYPNLADRVSPPTVEVESRSLKAQPYLINVPVDGGLCWNAPLPCTPMLDPDLAVDSPAGRIRFRIVRN